MSDLSPRQRQQLINLQRRVKCEGNVLVQQTKTLASILEWAEQEYVTLDGMLFGDRIQVTDAWLRAVEEALVSQGYAALSPIGNGNRIAQAQHSVTENKSQAIPPRYFRVLLALPNRSHTLRTTRQNDKSWQCIDEDWRVIDLSAYSHLIMVENLTLFYCLHELKIAWPNESLVVYRGDSIYHSGSSQLFAAWQNTGKPSMAMIDIDGFSLRLAQSRGYTHIAMPALSRLQALASKAHAPAKQHAYLANVNAEGGLSDYVTWLQQQQVGLKQEWMYHEQLHWVQVNA